jgi:hypothetical protein
MSAAESHWQKVYATRRPTDVSWYQPTPATSLQLIARYAPPPASVIDAGAGASTLVDGLLAKGYADLTLLDVSGNAIALSRSRLAARDGVCWLVQDITAFKPIRTWDVWHDRALFHFLKSSEDQSRYIAALNAGTRPGSIAVIATFASDGPEKCSGLPVQRYDCEGLAARIGAPFTLIDRRREDHVTPANAVQKFTYTVLKRT